MSADNGVYILITPVSLDDLENVLEYRVAHCRAIENIYSEENQKKYLQMYFGECQPTTLRLAAITEAHDLYDSIEKDGIVEYGVQTIRLNIIFPTL